MCKWWHNFHFWVNYSFKVLGTFAKFQLVFWAEKRVLFSTAHTFCRFLLVSTNRTIFFLSCLLFLNRLLLSEPFLLSESLNKAVFSSSAMRLMGLWLHFSLMHGSQRDNLVACNFNQIEDVPSKLKSNMKAARVCRQVWCKGLGALYDDDGNTDM